MIFQKGEKLFQTLKIRKLKKSQNQHIAKGVSPWFWQKIWKFFHLFSFRKIRQENVFDDILERKKTFLDSKIRKLKKSQIRIFQTGLVHGFGKKFGNFSIFLFFGKIRQENVFDDILERKKAFLDSKIRKLKKLQNQHISKWVSPWFW